MSRENKSFYALLGVLLLGPATGYEIKQTIEKWLSHFWCESYGQIYPNLKRLVEENLATVKTEVQVGKPNKNIYSITDRGRQVLTEWLMKPIVSHPPVKNEFLLKLFFSQSIPLEESIEQVKQHKQKMLEISMFFEHLKIDAAAQCQEETETLYRSLTLDYSYRAVKGIIEWCDDCIHRLEKSKSPVKEEVR
ncbi:PadR family transcriptional regulator [Heyndrickxia acidicola]|uniref:PadR family transcriptional regulator n=1 Tax=Heyndrickxia acidicola TaxID=209389 RepID=A0ABU6MK10_9BACI|nr:PadR family transcriptional regulator [Heyndrickxia acidicola]MED1204629.1 PadR family transcriptional regulator [Heyndrickxia acidicola]